MRARQGYGQAFLHQIVGTVGISYQRMGVTPQPRDMKVKCLPELSVGHRYGFPVFDEGMGYDAVNAADAGLFRVIGHSPFPRQWTSPAAVG